VRTTCGDDVLICNVDGTFYAIANVCTHDGWPLDQGDLCGRDPSAVHRKAKDYGIRISSMPYVITEPCIGTKDRSCVDVCPVDCIHGTESDPQLYIDPEVCIDCGACVSACPVEAIYADADVPEKWKHYATINADYYK
jgi:ferredoxin